MNLRHILCVTLVLLTAGCLDLKQPAVKVDYYQVEYGPAQSPASEHIDVVLGVRGFAIAATYDHNRMVYKDGTYERETRFYHRWVTNPADMVRDALFKDLKHSGNYSAVVQAPGSTAWNYEVQGYIQDIYENDLGGKWESVLNLDIILIGARSEILNERILFQKSYGASVVCKGKTPQAVVAAMSEAIEDISTKLQGDIYKAVQEDIKKEAMEMEARAEGRKSKGSRRER